MARALTREYPSNDGWGGDVWFDTASFNAPRVGTNAYQTFYHEIGHALGLKHGHQGDNGNNWVMTADRNSSEFSTMTYAEYIGQSTAGSSTVVSGHYAQSFMMYDIAALQHMYGADFTSNVGNTTYKFISSTGEMFSGNQFTPQARAE